MRNRASMTQAGRWSSVKRNMVVDLYALEARTKTARLLSDKRAWGKVVALIFVASFLLGAVVAW